MSRSPLASVGAARTTPGVPLDPAALSTSADEQVQRLQADLRLGLPVVLTTTDGALLVAAAETLGEARFRALAASGAAELVLTERRAAAFAATVPAEHAVLRLPVPGDADYAWLAALAGLDTPAPAAAEDATPPALAAATEQRARHDGGSGHLDARRRGGGHGKDGRSPGIPGYRCRGRADRLWVRGPGGREERSGLRLSDGGVGATL